MSKQENKEQTNQAVEIEDLSIEDAVQEEVKGGGAAKLESCNNLKQLAIAIV